MGGNQKEILSGPGVFRPHIKQIGCVDLETILFKEGKNLFFSRSSCFFFLHFRVLQGV